MKRPQVTPGESLQILRIAANILNKQYGQPTGGAPPALRLLGVNLSQ
jgi:hypothetical protein